VYKENQENEENSWEFTGLINHSISIQQVEQETAGTDHALEKLKNTMASIEQEREARKYVFTTPNHKMHVKVGEGRKPQISHNSKAADHCDHNRAAISTPESRPLKSMSKAQSRANHLKPLLANNRSTPSSPALGSSTPAHLRVAPTSAGLDMPFDHAIRKPLVHLLAVQPRPFLKIRRMVGTNPRKILEKVAKSTGKGEEEYALLDRAYKELDVWNFNYSDEDRQTAIQNAIHAFDRLRLPKDDQLWQKLLPTEERGKGKVLSRLALKDPAKAGSTPAMKPQSFDKKTGLPVKRKEQKKPEKEGVMKTKKTAKEGAAVEEKPRAMKSAAEANTPKVEPRRERQTNNHAKRTNAPGEERSPAGKQPKPSAAAKGLLNKPKNLSPLGVSPPVNASDFEDNHPVHKRLSAATSPRSGMKRKADDANGASHKPAPSNKRPHFESQSNSSSSSEERPLKVAKTAAKPSTNSVPQAKKAPASTTNGLNGHATHRHASPADSDSSTSSGSAPIPLSWRQSLEMARKFNIYYQKYKKLYLELSQSVEPPSEKKREELLEMHKRLERMKREVNSGAL
jgi:RNA polymerase II elongation factor ELL